MARWPREREEIEFKWISAPGRKQFLTKEEAEGLRQSHELEFVSRRAFSHCSVPSYRARPAMFAYFGAIVLGATKDGEVRGIQVDSDPREIIVECPGLYGGKSTPETKCGTFIRPEAETFAHMPRDTNIAQLQVFTRVITGMNEWHLLRAGTLELPKRAD